MLSRIHYAKPSITEREVAYATDAARNGWAENCYGYRGSVLLELLLCAVGSSPRTAGSSR